MANITELIPGIWTGGDLPGVTDDAVVDIGAWVDAGITHVVDNRIEWSDQELVGFVAPRIHYLHNGADDAGQRMPDQWFDRAVRFALDARTTDPASGVLLHCHMGINRGPSAAYAVLLCLGEDPIDAIDLIRTRRPIAAIGYAEDGLDWWHRRTEASPARRADDRQRLARWRLDHPHDTVRIIRTIRGAEAA
jgi:hypothetical protein